MTPTADAGSGGPVRVLLLVKGLGLGGAERLLVDQAIAGHGDQLQFTVASVRPDKVHFVPALHAAGVATVALRPAESRWPWPVHLARALRRTRPHVVHAHSPLPAAVARVLVRLGMAGRGAHHVYTEHNRWSAYRAPTRIVNAVTMAFDRQVWAVSAEARSSIRPAWLRDRAEVLHHGIDLEATRAAAAEGPHGPVPEQPPRAFTFVQVANRRREKAHEVMLAAFEQAARDDADLHLWLVGQALDDGEFAAAVAAHPAGDRIAVLGYRSDAPALIARADALALSSDHEGLPVAVMEALALGRPIVSTGVGGVPEAVTDGTEALLVPPRDPARLAAAMVELHRDRSLWERLAAGARLRASEFDARRAQDIQASAYRRLAGRQGER